MPDPRTTIIDTERDADSAGVALLQGVTAALGGALTTGDVGEVIVDKIREAFGAIGAALLIEDPGTARLALVASRNLTDAVCADLLDDDSAPSVAHRTGEAQLTSAFAFVPVRQGGRPVGALGISFARPRLLSRADRAMLESLSDLSGQALHRAALYEAERSAKDEALAASRIKDEFLATLSHELRTPLQSILGWARLLKTGLDPALVPRAIDSIDRNARAQANLLGDILDLSRIIRGRLKIEPRVTDLESIVSGALDTMRHAAEAKGIRLEATFEGTSRSIVGDPDRLQQVVWNLVANAVKFTPEGGRVDLDVLFEETGIVIRVRDTGIGVTPEFLPHVFDPFRQASVGTMRAHGGLGLGLAIVRRLVELHGGTVRAASDGKDQGATFTVELPIGTAVSSDDAELERPSSCDDPFDSSDALSLEGVRVLVVDDHADARDLVATTLARFGAVILMAESAVDALETAAREHPDILVSDIGMPDVDGCELLSRVRALPAPVSRIPAIALTAYARKAERSRVIEAGFQVHMSKPVDPRELARAVLELARSDSS